MELSKDMKAMMIDMVKDMRDGKVGAAVVLYSKRCEHDGHEGLLIKGFANGNGPDLLRIMGELNKTEKQVIKGIIGQVHDERGDEDGILEELKDL